MKVEVIGQHREGDIAVAPRGQITKQAAYLKAAFGKHARGQSHVVIGGHVPVKRRSYPSAILTGGANSRREEPGLSACINREIEPWGIKNGDAMQSDTGMGCSAATGVFV